MSTRTITRPTVDGLAVSSEDWEKLNGSSDGVTLASVNLRHEGKTLDLFLEGHPSVKVSVRLTKKERGKKGPIIVAHAD